MRNRGIKAELTSCSRKRLSGSGIVSSYDDNVVVCTVKIVEGPKNLLDRRLTVDIKVAEFVNMIAVIPGQFILNLQAELNETFAENEAEELAEQIAEPPDLSSPNEVREVAEVNEGTPPSIVGAKWLIQDSDGGGWAMDNPIEGWCFTTIENDAKRFDTYEEARAVADKHYNPGRQVRVRIYQEL